MLGNLLKTIIKAPITVVAVGTAAVVDVASLGANKIINDKFLFEEAADWMDEE